MKAILTRFYGATNTRPSRYFATDGDGNWANMTVDYALSSEAHHDAVALKLCRKMDWAGTLVRGTTANGYAYVWESEATRITVDALMADALAPGARVGRRIMEPAQ